MHPSVSWILNSVAVYFSPVTAEALSFESSRPPRIPKGLLGRWRPRNGPGFAGTGFFGSFGLVRAAIATRSIAHSASLILPARASTNLRNAATGAP